jgi:hypothetical protein
MASPKVELLAAWQHPLKLISTASGRSVFRDPYIDRIAAATTGSGSGHGAGCIDMTCPFCSRDEGNNNGRSRIMATTRTGSRTSSGASRISHQGRPSAQICRLQLANQQVTALRPS